MSIIFIHRMLCRGVIPENGYLLIFPVILPVFARCMHGSLFTYGDCIKDDVYDNDYSAEDILLCDCHILRVDQQVDTTQ